MAIRTAHTTRGPVRTLRTATTTLPTRNRLLTAVSPLGGGGQDVGPEPCQPQTVTDAEPASPVLDSPTPEMGPPSPTHVSGGDTDSAATHPAGGHRFGLPERPKSLGAALFLLRDYDWPQLPFRSPLRGPWLTSVFGAVLLASLPIVIITGLLSWIAYGPRFGQAVPGMWVGCTCRCSTGRPGRRGCTG